jgi:hypothetical protein
MTERPEDFAAAFGAALERRRTSLSRLRDRLYDRGHHISLATLSYWRSGDRIPTRPVSMEALSEIESLLDVKDGYLTDLAVRARRDRSVPTPFDALALGQEPGRLFGERDVDRILFHMTVDVDRAAEEIVSTVTQLFVATKDGVRGVSMFVGPDPDGRNNRSRVEALTGCRIAAVNDHDGAIRVAQLDFGRACRAGESVLTQTRVVDAGPWVLDEHEYGIVAEQRLEECLLLVRFIGSSPRRCWAGYQEGSSDEEWAVDLHGDAAAHVRETAFGPGVCRIRWEW